MVSFAEGAPAGSDELRADIDFAKSKVYPALVNIQVVGQSFSGGRSRKFPGAGSGVIVSPAGHVLTNYHVAGETTRIVCTLPDGETIQADVVAHDPLTDLSVLKLRMEQRKNANTGLPFATLGDSDALAVGQYVLAMGNPLTLSSSMTLGVVSNVKRVFTNFTGTEMEEMDLGSGQMTGLFTRWIQHDALILPGNSGGPLVNLKGEVVGINELGGSGVGFAIPSNLAGHVLNQALTHGKVLRGWFGLSIIPIKMIGLDSGAIVSWVVQGGAADEAGIRAGDVLHAFDGEAVDVKVFEEVPLFYKRMAEFKAGQEVRVKFERAGERKETLLTVAPMEKFLDDEVEYRSWGLTVRGVTSHMALVRKYPDCRGVLVTGVRPGRPAASAKPKLERDDVILSMNGKTVSGRSHFTELIASLSGSEEVVLRLRRGDEDVVTVIDLDTDESDFKGGELPKAWIGIKTQVLTPSVAKALSLEKKKGFRVTQVYRETKAAEAGIQPGDVIVALNGGPLKASRVQDSEILRRRVENLVPGTKATLTVYRNETRMEIELELEETPAGPSEAASAEESFLEFAVRDLTFWDRIKYKWGKDKGGVLVVDATGGGWASLAGLRTKDLLLAVQGREIKDVAAFEKIMDDIMNEKPQTVALFIRRDYRTDFKVIEPDWSRYEAKKKTKQKKQ